MSQHAFRNLFKNKQKLIWAGVLGISVSTLGTLGYSISKNVLHATSLDLHPPRYPWPHREYFGTYDYASVRRGYFVYKQVCAACHSMEYMPYRRLVNVCLTEDEAKAEAAEIMVQDGPDDQGNMFERPGKLTDKCPAPYANDEAAKAANNGALPPDLSLITLSRKPELNIFDPQMCNGEDYIFSLLTSYKDPPAGVIVSDGQGYNPYFHDGGVLGMAQQLYAESVEYDDGTLATVPQMAKDVTTFLAWAAEPYREDGKRKALKVIMVFTVILGVSWYWKRVIWAPIKYQQLAYKPPRR